MTDRRPNQPTQPTPASDLRPQDAVDLLLDRGVDATRRRALLEDLRSNAGATQDLASLRAVVAMFDEPIDTPDMSGAILEELEQRRRFRPASRRTLVRIGRVAVGACVVLTIGGVALVRQHAPNLDPSPAQTPISAVVESSHSEFAGLIGSTVEMAGRLASGIQPVVASAANAANNESLRSIADARDAGPNAPHRADPQSASPDLLARSIPLRFLMDASAPAAATSFDDDRVFIYTPAPNPQRPGLLIDADGRVFTLGDPSGLGVPSRSGSPGVDINGVWKRPNTSGRSASPQGGSDFSGGFPIPGRER